MEPLTVLILAGGKSRRMGLDKAWLDLGGQPLVERVARRLLPVAAEIIFSANDPTPFASLIERLPVPARVVVDLHPDAGPLAGLHAGLFAARHPLLLAVGTDMPFVDPALVTFMIGLSENQDAVVPLLVLPRFSDPQAEPLHALYRHSCLPSIEARLALGQRRVIGFLEDVRVCYVKEQLLREIDPDLRSFRNLNTPEEWAAARAAIRYPGVDPKGSGVPAP